MRIRFHLSPLDRRDLVELRASSPHHTSPEQGLIPLLIISPEGLVTTADPGEREADLLMVFPSTEIISTVRRSAAANLRHTSAGTLALAKIWLTACDGLAPCGYTVRSTIAGER